MSDRTILIVDDNETLAENQATLFRREGWQARAVFSGRDAVAAVRDTDYDAVVLDMRMPGMDGFETLERLRKQRPDICVLFLTAYGDIDAAVRALREGAVNLLLKPISFDTLHAIVEDGIKRKHDEVDARVKEQAEQEKQRIESNLTLARGMAHNIKNGLSALGTRHNLLAGDKTHADRTRHLREAGDILHTMDAAIRQLYHYGKVEEVETGAVALLSAVDRAIDGVRKRRRRNHGQMAVDLAVSVAEDLYVQAEPELLAEAVACVVDNAIDAAPEGTVRISSNIHSGLIDLEVADDGGGFSPELLGKAHKPFVSGKKPTHVGFGLAFVDHVAGCFGGSLAYANASVGHGAVVTLTLPKARDGSRAA